MIKTKTWRNGPKGVHSETNSKCNQQQLLSLRGRVRLRFGSSTFPKFLCLVHESFASQAAATLVLFFAFLLRILCHLLGRVWGFAGQSSGSTIPFFKLKVSQAKPQRLYPSCQLTNPHSSRRASAQVDTTPTSFKIFIGEHFGDLLRSSFSPPSF